MSQVRVSGNASGTGIFTVASPNSNTNRTLTLPDNTGTLVTTASPGTVLKVQQFTSPGSTTSSTSVTGLQGSRFSYTPVSTSSTLYLMHSAYVTGGGGGGYAAGGCYVYYYIAEYNGSTDVAISSANYLYNYQYSSTYGQPTGVPGFAQIAVSNTSLTTRLFNTTGACIYAAFPLGVQNIYLTVIEVAA